MFAASSSLLPTSLCFVGHICGSGSLFCCIVEFIEEGDNEEIEDEGEEQIYKLDTSEESEGGEEDLEEMFDDDSD